MDYLGRQRAPLSEAMWRAIDEAVVKAARDRLTGRRFLDLEGPFGVGLTAIEVGHDDYCRQPEPDEAGAVMGRTIPVPMLRKSFQLSIRRVAAYLERGLPLNLSPAQDAAEAVAKREEELVYRGQQDFGVSGLLTVEGRLHIAGGNWSQIDRALNDTIEAVTELDKAGFRGPYALVLEPPLYNALFRLYPGSYVSQLDHLRRLCQAGIFKADIEGGVVVDPRVGVIIIGQDLRTGYISQDGVHHQLYVSESMVLRIDEPRAVCTIAARLGAEPAGSAASA
ncbi:MAG TPA: family 1 encapsulin nanocompartment shell protein [Stellaceae bacterium]|nr:family 1 encapsulin nanocompartment shell protein [Stellaceae bacterium]